MECVTHRVVYLVGSFTLARAMVFRILPCHELGKKKPQISPLRCAPVEMTILLLMHGGVSSMAGNTNSTQQQNCHLDRSAAQWRDLRFLLAEFVAGQNEERLVYIAG